MANMFLRRSTAELHGRCKTIHITRRFVVLILNFLMRISVSDCTGEIPSLKRQMEVKYGNLCHAITILAISAIRITICIFGTVINFGQVADMVFLNSRTMVVVQLSQKHILKLILPVLPATEM